MPSPGMARQIARRTGTTVNPEKLYIDGAWRKPSGTAREHVVSSTTEEAIGSFPLGASTEIDDAVRAANRALGDREGWAGFGPAERAKAMRLFADAIERRRDELGQLIAEEVGTPLERATGSNADTAAALLRFYADIAEDTPTEDLRPARIGHSLVVREPIGVVAMIAPWNYPLSTLFFKLAPALAAGCTAVVKPASNTALNSFIIAEAADEAGLPPGVLNIVPTDRATGEYLVSHPDVHKVAFTGSTPVGRRIGRICGEMLKPVTLELGGKSAALLLEDAPIDTLLESLHDLSFANNGQTCTNNSRLIVPETIYGEVVDAITQTVATWPMGDPMDSRTVIGPVVSRAHKDSIEGYYALAKREGARITIGGNCSTGTGFFVAPTVMADVTADMTVFREEIFGPAISITKYSGDLEEGLRIANDSNYGLSGAVFTADETVGITAAKRIETGTVAFNMANFDIGAPFGGRKDSGIGFELGAEAIGAYTHYKTVFVPTPPKGFEP